MKPSAEVWLGGLSSSAEICCPPVCGQIVGTAFDSNIHGIAGDFTYDAALNRTIAVSKVAISEALQKVYGDTALAGELSQQ